MTAPVEIETILPSFLTRAVFESQVYVPSISEELKKNGVLGRDFTVQKTMLDESKGEKLEDVMVAFSKDVLQKDLIAEKDWKSSIAREFAVTLIFPRKTRDRCFRWLLLIRRL